MKKTHVLAKFHQDVDTSSVGCEFSFSESSIHMKKHTKNKVMYWLDDKSIVTGGPQETNPVFSLGAIV